MFQSFIRNGYFVFIVIVICSCKAMRFNRNIVDPTVETRQSLQSFLSRHSFSQENQFVMDADSSKKKYKVWDLLGYGGTQIYDSKGRAVCYQGVSHCDGVIMEELFAGKLDSFHFCENEKPLDSVLSKLNTLDTRQKKWQGDFPASDYYIVEYWQKFRGRKLGYKTGTEWTEKQIARQKKFTITYIKVNADFLDEWGFTAGNTFSLNKKKGKHGIQTSFYSDSTYLQYLPQ